MGITVTTYGFWLGRHSRLGISNKMSMYAYLNEIPCSKFPYKYFHNSRRVLRIYVLFVLGLVLLICRVVISCLSMWSSLLREVRPRVVILLYTSAFIRRYKQ